MAEGDESRAGTVQNLVEQWSISGSTGRGILQGVCEPTTESNAQRIGVLLERRGHQQSAVEMGES